MTILARLLLIAGFCVGTLGAAGFDKTPEPMAWPLFLGGLALLFAGGALAHKSRRTQAPGGESKQGEMQRVRRQLVAIRDTARDLVDSVSSSPPAAIRDQIDALSEGELFDLVNAHEQIATLLGFQAFARVWEGVATGERLLNRAWSMLTDGAVEEGLREIPLACAQFEAAVESFDG